MVVFLLSPTPIPALSLMEKVVADRMRVKCRIFLQDAVLLKF